MTGDEVLLGRVVERNAAFLAADLDARGIDIARTAVVPDVLDAIVQALRDALASGSDLIITSGGLGPTHDDLTMEAVALAVGRTLAVDKTALSQVQERVADAIARYGILRARIDAGIDKQASLPVGGRALRPIGTAPGCVLVEGGSTIVVLPGPPAELQPMWSEAIQSAPVAEILGRAPARHRRTLRMIGVSESELVAARARVDQGLVARVPHGIYTRAGELDLVIDGLPGESADADGLADVLSEAIGGRVYSRDGRIVDTIVAELLVARSETLAVAESCTGGSLGARLTATAGASAWFVGGVIAYADAIKVALLGVSPATLAEVGAVAARTAIEMAQGVRARTGANWALSVTGIAGPGGGSSEKPVGLVYIGLAGPDGAMARELRIPGTRDGVRLRSSTAALHELRSALLAQS